MSSGRNNKGMEHEKCVNGSDESEYKHLLPSLNSPLFSSVGVFCFIRAAAKFCFCAN